MSRPEEHRSAARSRRRYAACAAALAACVLLFPGDAQAACGDFNDDGSVTATDALGALSSAVGVTTCSVTVCDVNGDGAVSATDALVLLGRAVGQSVSLLCPGAGVCTTDEDFFFEQVWTPVLTDCVACHQTGGVAGSTRYVLAPSSESGYLETNFDAIAVLTDESQTPGGRDAFLTKPLGTNHFGGQRLGMTESSTLYQNLVELVDRYDDPVVCEDTGTVDFAAGLVASAADDLLRRYALIFAGRLPTSDERMAVALGDEQTLRETLRGLMEGDGFRDFVVEASNDQLLTDRYIDGSVDSFLALGSEYDYPNLLTRLNAAAEGEEQWRVYQSINTAIAREPLMLIHHVVDNELPWSEVLTADYMMVNPWSASVYAPNMQFPDPDDDDDWRVATNDGYRLPDFPHAGILSSPMFLNRYPSSANNRNRRRSRYTWKFFLGVDIEALAPRTSDPEVLNTDNPTMNNVNCTVCHNVMDPVAGAFQNWADNGQYLQWDNDSLPWSYKEGDLYQWGDRWYRDMRAPGFNGTQLPSSDTDASLAWLGTEIAADSRFPSGAVAFWWKGVFGRDAIPRPTDVNDPAYDNRLAAWQAEQEEVARIAAAFADGTAGTGQNGVLNVKDLLVELALSPLMSASALDASVSGSAAADYDGVGRETLLTPKQLDRKIIAVTGRAWAPRWAPTYNELLERYRFFYGGIDSDGNTERADQMNAVMSTVVERFANEMSCPLVVYEFTAAASERLLFPFVEADTTPQNDEAAFRANLVHLHDRILGENLATDDPEIDATLALFNEIRSLRISTGKGQWLSWGSGHCNVGFWEDGGDQYVSHDPDHILRSWVAVLAYLLGDYEFLFE